MTRYGMYAPAQQVFEFVEERFTPTDGVALALFFSQLEQVVKGNFKHVCISKKTFVTPQHQNK